MNEIGTAERPNEANRPGRACAGKVSATRPRAVAVAGMLALTAVFGGPAAAEPRTRQVPSSAPAQVSVIALKREYLRCDRVSSLYRLTPDAAAYCGAVSTELLRREFDGDLDLLLAWWREARQEPVPQ